MSLYVYEDSERTKKLLAKDSTTRNKSIRYFCPNHNCMARMFLWNIEGESIAYFQSAGKPGHVDKCPFGMDNSFNPNNCKEEGFNSENAINNLMVPTANKQSDKEKPGEHGTGETEERIPHTIRQIYDMCKAHYFKDTFNGIVIGQILVDDRSMYMYPKGVYGYRVIEAKCRKRWYEDNKVYLVSSLKDEEYEFELKFKDTKLFLEIRDLLFHNKEHVIVVAGKWEKSGVFKRFSTDFNSKKQIKVLRQNY